MGRAPVSHNRGMQKVLEDQQLGAAIELAREAAVIEAEAASVGEHLEMAMEDERLATHLFACLHPGYVGWRWAVTVARAPEQDEITVCDVVLLPGPDSLVAPPWVPWSERVQPGDLGVGDVLVTPTDDLRLIAGLTGEDDLETASSASPLNGFWELGLGRVRVLSVVGRDEAAERWFEGDMGPSAAMAKSAPNNCSTCGFLLPIGGPLGQMFGVCANLIAPADGHVVAMNYGCGGHSEVTLEVSVPLAENATDEFGWDHLDLTAPDLDDAEQLPEDLIAAGLGDETLLAAGAILEVADATDSADETGEGDTDPPTLDAELAVEDRQDDTDN